LVLPTAKPLVLLTTSGVVKTGGSRSTRRARRRREWEDDPVDEMVGVAVANNANWCDLVCRSHGISTSWFGGFWVSCRPSPQFYPEGITLQENVAPEQLINELPDGLCSIKDSFSDLDLADHGFERLFDARSGAPCRRAPFDRLDDC
jgi:hypothetical protein